MGDREELRDMRITVLVFSACVCAYAIAMRGTSIYEMVSSAYHVTLVGAFVPLAAGLFWKRATTQGAIFSIVLGLVYNYLPFMILPIYTSVEKLDNSLVEAAYDLGAGPVRAFSRVIIPLTKPGIAAGALLVFVPAIAMYAITTLMGGGSNPTIGEVIQNQFTKARNQPFGAALGVLLMLLFLTSFLILGRKKSSAHTV